MREGDEVEFALVLGEYDTSGSYRVRCTGRVVRVTQQESTYTAAVHFESYAL
jgi:hypothetical protein